MQVSPVNKTDVVTRHCHKRENCNRHSEDVFDVIIDGDVCSSSTDFDTNDRKKTRSEPPPAVSPTAIEENETREQPRQWWFSRSMAEQHNSGMILSENLGSAPDVVESLTHDVKNWSLTKFASPRNKERCKNAQRQVRMARRRCLEAQRERLALSSVNDEK